MIDIAPCSPREPEVRELLTQSHALMTSLYPPEENFFLEVDELCASHIHMFSAQENGQHLGCVAVLLNADYAELKSLFVAPYARGLGLGAQLLSAAENCVKAHGVSSLKLETGAALEAAIALYSKAGFMRCGAFGDYLEIHSSVFMSKDIS